jgi:hypothetical protein
VEKILDKNLANWTSPWIVVMSGVCM